MLVEAVDGLAMVLKIVGQLQLGVYEPVSSFTITMVSQSSGSTAKKLPFQISFLMPKDQTARRWSSIAANSGMISEVTGSALPRLLRFFLLALVGVDLVVCHPAVVGASMGPEMFL